MDVHGGHALIESVAAVVLTLGGAAILSRAWRGPDRRVTHPGSPAAGSSGSSDAWIVVALVSAAAAAIHLAAAPEHVEALGDLGLGFYWAALLQGGFALAWLLSARPPRLAAIGLTLNVGLILVWAWSRTVGIGLPGGPEPIGIADAATVLLETGLIAMLAASVIARRPSMPALRVYLPSTSIAVAVGGIAVVVLAIAIVDVGHGHGHGHTDAAADAGDTAHTARASAP